MQEFRTTFIAGLRDAMRLRLALPLYLAGLLLGLLQTWPLLLGLADGRAERLDLTQLLSGGDALLNVLTSQSSNAPLAAAWLVLLPILSFVYGLVYNFFSGGILSAWAATRPFWPGCRRFFFAYTGLGLLLVLPAIGVASLASVLATVANLPATVVAVSAIVVLQLLNLVGEYARALAVVRDRRNPFWLFGAACSFCARNPVTLLFGLLGLALQLGFAAIYALIAPLLGTSPIIILLDQVLVFGLLWVKLLRLAWARSYAQPMPTSILDTTAARQELSQPE